MNAAALAICGAAWLGGITAVIGPAWPSVLRGARRGTRRRRPLAVSPAAIGLAVALAALPTLVLVDSTSLGAGAIWIGLAGLVGAVAAGAVLAVVAPAPSPALAGGSGRAGLAPDPSAPDPFAGGLDAVAVLLAAGAAAVAGLGVAVGAGRFPASGGSGGVASSLASAIGSTATVGLDPVGAAALAAGLGLVTAGLPGALFGTGSRRGASLSVAILGGALLDRAVGPWSPAIAIVVPALVVAIEAVGAPRLVPILSAAQARSAVGGGARRLSTVRRVSIDPAVLRLAVLAGPSMVGLSGLAFLLSTEASSADAAARSTALIATVGGFGIALAVLADVELGGWRDPAPLLPIAAATPVAALALRIGDPVAALLVAAVAALLAASGTGHRVEHRDARPWRPVFDSDRRRQAGSGVLDALAVGPVGAGAWSGAAIALIAFGVALVLGVGSAGDAPAELGLVAVALGIALAVGAIPFHRGMTALVDRVPHAALGATLGWLPGVAASIAFVALAPAASSRAVPVRLDGTEAIVVVAVAVLTVVLGGLAAVVQDDLGHALAYLVGSQAGWLVLAAVAPSSASAPAAAWIPAFAAGAFAAGGGVSLALADPASRRLRDLGGFARRNPVAVAALVAAIVAFVGLPGTATWNERQTIARSVLGRGIASDAVAVGSALAALLAIGRVAVVGIADPSRRVRLWRPIWERGPDAAAAWIATGSVAILALVAVALGIGLR